MNRLYFYLTALLLSFTACTKPVEDPKPPEENNVPPSPYKLQYMEMEEHEHYGLLHLYGLFADSSAGSKVKIGNHTYTGTNNIFGNIVSWSNIWIIVKVATSDDDGGGYVSVLTGGYETNKRLLNVWKGDMYYKEPDEGTLLKDIHFSFYLRADSKPHDATITFNPHSSFSWLSTAFWWIGGTGSSHASTGDLQVSLEERSNPLPFDMNEPYQSRVSAPSNFQCELTYTNRKFVVSALRIHQINATKKTTLPSGSPIPTIVDFPFQVEVLPLNATFTIEFEGNTDVIKAGKWTSAYHSTQYGLYWDQGEAPHHMYLNTLEWARIEPKFK